MAAKTILAARRYRALESISKRLERIGDALGVDLRGHTLPKLPDELHRSTFQMEWCDGVLASIEKELVGDSSPDEDAPPDEDEG